MFKSLDIQGHNLRSRGAIAMSSLPVHDAPLRPVAIALSRAIRSPSKLFRLLAKSWMEWSKFEYELFRARSHDEHLRVRPFASLQGEIW
jgi:hypothetical protein